MAQGLSLNQNEADINSKSDRRQTALLWSHKNSEPPCNGGWWFVNHMFRWKPPGDIFIAKYVSTFFVQSFLLLLFTFPPGIATGFSIRFCQTLPSSLAPTSCMSSSTTSKYLFFGRLFFSRPLHLQQTCRLSMTLWCDNHRPCHSHGKPQTQSVACLLWVILLAVHTSYVPHHIVG